MFSFGVVALCRSFFAISFFLLFLYSLPLCALLFHSHRHGFIFVWQRCLTVHSHFWLENTHVYRHFAIIFSFFFSTSMRYKCSIHVHSNTKKEHNNNELIHDKIGMMESSSIWKGRGGKMFVLFRAWWYEFSKLNVKTIRNIHRNISVWHVPSHMKSIENKLCVQFTRTHLQRHEFYSIFLLIHFV